MTEHFEVLSSADYDKLIDAVSLITVYIAGADGEIETKELEWAERITKYRAFNEQDDNLSDFYKVLGKDYSERVHNYVSELPNQPSQRNPIIEQRLSALNPILASLNPELGAELYKFYKAFAKHVAKATGGFLGYLSIGPKEAELIGLEMIDPIK